VASGAIGPEPAALLQGVFAAFNPLAASPSANLPPLSPAAVFDALAGRGDPDLRQQLAQLVDVVLAPGSWLAGTVNPGDILLRRGDGAMGHAAVIAGPDLPRAGRGSNVTCEPGRSGRYAQVVETGARPHRVADRFARRIAAADGRADANTCVVRVRSHPAEVGWAETDTTMPAGPRGSPAYVRWVQAALNQLTGSQLTVDGVLGTQTRRAIQRFQESHGLLPDGQVGSRTEAALRVALAPVASGTLAGAPASGASSAGRACRTLDRFALDSDRLASHHPALLVSLARDLLALPAGSAPRVLVTGHTDAAGSEQHNLDLGRRRAQTVHRALIETLERIRPGSSRGMTFVVETRGESERTSPDPALNRRVEVCHSRRQRPRPPACPAGQERLRLHLKILSSPTTHSIDAMLRAMRQTYGPAGFHVEVASRETLSLAHLEVLDIDCPSAAGCHVMPCASANLNAEMLELYRHRNHVGANELAVYFVRLTNPSVNGLCDHPPGSPGVVVASIATEFTLAHEIGHVLGLNHVGDTDRLMFGSTNSITNPPPDLIASEIQTMRASNLTVPC
jgi:outer membrane protein OmpA-like peptidoglycan-associated protein